MERNNLPNIKALGIVTSAPRGRTHGDLPTFTHIPFSKFLLYFNILHKIEEANRKKNNEQMRYTNKT
jgi:hypothetical protein